MDAEGLDRKLLHSGQGGAQDNHNLQVCRVDPPTNFFHFFFENWVLEGRFHNVECCRSTTLRCETDSHNRP